MHTMYNTLCITHVCHCFLMVDKNDVMFYKCIAITTLIHMNSLSRMGSRSSENSFDGLLVSVIIITVVVVLGAECVEVCVVLSVFIVVVAVVLVIILFLTSSLPVCVHFFPVSKRIFSTESALLFSSTLL